MPNIHAINADGTEYGIEAENGITQAQVAKIGTIGDVANLVTDNKTTLVNAINEIATPTEGGALTVTIDPSATVSSANISRPMIVGKIAFLSLGITHVAGENIGGLQTQVLFKTSLRLATGISVYAQDWGTGNIARFFFSENGDIDIRESIGIASGNNEFHFTAILPLA